MEALLPSLGLGGNDAIKSIWKHLEPEDVATCMRVNKMWRSHFGSDEVWKQQASKLNFAALLMEKYERRGLGWRAAYPKMLSESKKSLWIPIKESLQQYSRKRSRMIRAIDDLVSGNSLGDKKLKEGIIKVITETLGAWTWWIPATEYHDWTQLIGSLNGPHVARLMDNLISYFKELDATFVQYQNPEDVEKGIHEVLLVVTPTCDSYIWDVRETSSFAITWYFEWITLGVSLESRDRQQNELSEIFDSTFSSYHVRDLNTILQAEDQIRAGVLEKEFDAKYGRQDDFKDQIRLAEADKGRFDPRGSRIRVGNKRTDPGENYDVSEDAPFDDDTDAPSNQVVLPSMGCLNSDDEADVQRGSQYNVEGVPMPDRAYILACWDRAPQ
eukprot:TRINITY_DN7725_c0_g1_i1.p1 TRINITY_DN7725_c0_g1~~TRINITY_DN7725_c0_g1_i1.p1  ORF type:complete len:411 (-),score=67.86 TRINITY_DN7725_c0_g1_i1:40-1194(-)